MGEIRILMGGRGGGKLVAFLAAIAAAESAEIDMMTDRLNKMKIVAVDEMIPQPAENSYWKGKKSKGEKKRQRSEWNNRMKGYRK